METPLALLNVHRAHGAAFGVLCDVLQTLLGAGFHLFHGVFLARLADMPGNLVFEAHGVVAFAAGYHAVVFGTNLVYAATRTLKRKEILSVTAVDGGRSGRNVLVSLGEKADVH